MCFVIEIIVYHAEGHMNSRGKVGSKERCQGVRMQTMRNVCRSQCMGFSVLPLSPTDTRKKIVVLQAHFHAQQTGARTIVITRKRA